LPVTADRRFDEDTNKHNLFASVAQDVASASSKVVGHNKQHALHLLCSFIEGTFTPFAPKKKEKGSHDQSHIPTINQQEVRLEEARTTLKTLIWKRHFVIGHATSNSKYEADQFNGASAPFHDIQLYTWCCILCPSDPDSTMLQLSRGVEHLKPWLDVAIHCREYNSLLTELLNLQLEYSILDAALSGDTIAIDPFDIMEHTLLPAVNSCTKSLSNETETLSIPPMIQYAIIVAESLTPLTYRVSSYVQFLHSKKKMSAVDLLMLMEYEFVQARMKTETSVAEKNADGPGHYFKALLSSTNALLGRLSNDLPSCYAAELWQLVIAFKLALTLTDNHAAVVVSKNKKTTNHTHVRKSLASVRTDYDRILASNKVSHLKDLWIMPFHVLRPLFSVSELSSHLLAMAETGIHLAYD
jgi:hypothetical protein